MGTLAAVTVFSYLLGAVPFSYIAGKLLKGIDIRNSGSGNAGASNALRVLGRGAGAAVLKLDFAKGFTAVFLAQVIAGAIPSTQTLQDAPLWTGIAAAAASVTGHIYPVYIRFRGGKGVATAAGCVTALYPPAFVICIAVFILVLAKTRMASAASLSAVWALPILYPAAAFFTSPFLLPYEILFISCAALITFRHRENIARILDGTENRLKLFRGQ